MPPRALPPSPTSGRLEAERAAAARKGSSPPRSGAPAPLETRGSYSQRNALVSQPTEFIHFFHAAQHEIFLTPSIPVFIHDSSELSQDDCSCEVQCPAIG